MLTMLFAGLLSLLFFKISIDTIKARRKYQISTGYGPNNEIENIVSAHANFVAYTPLFLILSFLLEWSRMIPIVVQFSILLVFLIGRILHYRAFKSQQMNLTLRVVGMHMTLWPLLLAALGVIGISLFLFQMILTS